MNTKEKLFKLGLVISAATILGFTFWLLNQISYEAFDMSLIAVGFKILVFVTTAFFAGSAFWASKELVEYVKVLILVDSLKTELEQSLGENPFFRHAGAGREYTPRSSYNFDQEDLD